jgi:hypothetical protein
LSISHKSTRFVRAADFNPRGALALLGKAEALRGLKPAVQAAFVRDDEPNARGSVATPF